MRSWEGIGIVLKRVTGRTGLRGYPSYSTPYLIRQEVGNEPHIMTPSLGGSDPNYDLSPEQKDQEEQKLRQEARKLLSGKNKKERTKKLNRANEISRKKAKRAHQGTD